jgi:hypothetical protein
MQVAATTPHTTGRLLTVRPDIADLLAVVALREAILGLVCLYSDLYVLEGFWKISCDFAVLGNVIRNRGMFLVTDPSVGDGRVDEICLTPIMSKPASISPSEISSAGVSIGRFRNTALVGFRDFG